MSTISTERPRLASHMTRTRFLHIEDSLDRGKLRFFIGAFAKGQGANATAYAFMDLDDARVLLGDMAWGKPVNFVDHKGGMDGNNSVMSRTLKIQTREDKLWINIENGPGEQMIDNAFPQGRFAVKPRGAPTAEISIPLTIYEARKLAHACLAYLHAWDVVRMLGINQQEPGER
jgi:hypothetical protein